MSIGTAPLRVPTIRPKAVRGLMLADTTSSATKGWFGHLLARLHRRIDRALLALSRRFARHMNTNRWIRIVHRWYWTTRNAISTLRFQNHSVRR